MWLNEMDVQEARNRALQDDKPNLQHATEVLDRLVEWTNNNSDGWPYWRKPSAASKRLQEAIYPRYFGAWDKRVEDDITDAELKKAIAPIKAFCTRQGIACDVRGILADTGPSKY